MATVKYKGSKSNRPKVPFSTPVELLVASWSTEQGVARKTYESKGTIFCSWKTFGGTESNMNGQLSVIDTANVETWFRSDLTSSSVLRVRNPFNFSQTRDYEVIGEPEDIDMRHQFMKFKVKRVGGNV